MSEISDPLLVGLDRMRAAAIELQNEICLRTVGLGELIVHAENDIDLAAQLALREIQIGQSFLKLMGAIRPIE